MKQPFHHRRTPWIPLLATGFVLSLTVNTYFLFTTFQRNIVVAVPDGDSLDLADGRRIRLLGIDAPEKGRCMAEEARRRLVELAQGRHVRLKHIVRDSFGRQLAIVIIEDWKSWFGYMRWRFHWSDWLIGRIESQDPLLQHALVSAGLARNESSSGNPYHQVLTDAQEIAKSNKLGIWSDACRGATSGRESCMIKGNTRAGKKSYYTPDCPTYPDVLVDTAFGDAWFCSTEDATKAGFTLATSCN